MAAELPNARLIRADLRNANLRGANLTGADLRGADLRRADLSIADLSDTINLTQPQLDTACGTSNTKLVKGLTLKECSVDVIE